MRNPPTARHCPLRAISPPRLRTDAHISRQTVVQVGLALPSPRGLRGRACGHRTVAREVVRRSRAPLHFSEGAGGRWSQPGVARRPHAATAWARLGNPCAHPARHTLRLRGVGRRREQSAMQRLLCRLRRSWQVCGRAPRAHTAAFSTSGRRWRTSTDPSAGRCRVSGPRTPSSDRALPTATWHGRPGRRRSPLRCGAPG
jgi:hypothetical protein